jgi:hypothetical protein
MRGDGLGRFRRHGASENVPAIVIEHEQGGHARRPAAGGMLGEMLPIADLMFK